VQSRGHSPPVPRLFSAEAEGREQEQLPYTVCEKKVPLLGLDVNKTETDAGSC